ncbi:MAG TPA: hypothetical protein VFS97_14575 [Nitrososphaeraceae archaeon]|nr:hypothetical protein [Nitrososphaeraceae archaeon]
MQIVQNDTSFVRRAITALGVSIIADGLDYFAAPLFGTPLIGDIFDFIITSLLYSITRSKSATAINMTEFIPFIGDFIPVYTISTLLWIGKGLRKPERIYYREEPDYHKNNVARRFVGTLKRRLIKV